MAGTTVRQKVQEAAGRKGEDRARALEYIKESSEPLVKRVRRRLGVTQQALSRMTGFSPRAIAGWERGEKLSDASQQRMEEMRRLQEALEQVMNPAFIAGWLQAPNPAFEGLKPIEVIERGEIDRIWRMIFYLDAGVPS